MVVAMLLGNRLRQLSAHEVGHTLGLNHNYYDSTAGRISVLDYPHPFVTLRSDGTIDLSDAYAVGIGEWDKVAVRYTYGHFPPGTNAATARQAILAEAAKRDLRYLSNQDVDYSPRVDQWSNGTDTTAELKRMMEVRRVALARVARPRVRPAGRRDHPDARRALRCVRRHEHDENRKSR